ncbi:MAG: thioesterase domain-containing protein, partial [Sphingomonas sp.]
MSAATATAASGRDIASSAVLLSLARLARMAQESELEAPLPSAPQLVCLRRGWPDKAPLVLIHPVGGSVIPYRDLVPHIGGERPVYAIQSQSGAVRSSCDHDDVASLAADYIAQVASIDPSGGVILGGYSLGGAVAFEMARQAAANGLKIVRLVIIDTPATIRPVSADTETPITINQLLMFGQMLAAVRQRPFGVFASDLEALPDERRIHRVIAELRALEVIGEGIE